MIVLAVVTDAASFMCKYRERNSRDVTRLPPQQPGDSQRWSAVEAVAIKRPSGWKRRCKEIAAPLSTRLQQLQQQTSLTTDLNCARAAGSSALGSPPDDAVALLHSNLVLPHASLLVHSYIPPGTRKKLCGFGRKVAAWLLCD